MRLEDLSEKTIRRLLLGATIGVITLYLGGIGVVIYVIAHFVIKYW